MHTLITFRKCLLSSAITVSLGTGSLIASPSASAAIITADWNGLMTILDPLGNPLQNASKPYYYDATWSYGQRTQISGTLSFDTVTGTGSGQSIGVQFFSGNPILPLQFRNMTLQAIGDGNGGSGNQQ